MVLGWHVRFQSFQTSMFWNCTMYFSVMMSTNGVADNAPRAGNPTEVRTALSAVNAAGMPAAFVHAVDGGLVVTLGEHDASAMINWFSDHVTIGWRNGNWRRIAVLRPDAVA